MHLHLAFTSLTNLFFAFAHASPILPRAGAGGPVAKPIPSTCTLTNPLIQHNTSKCTTNNSTNTSGYKPSLTFTSTHFLYESYFTLPTPAEELWTQCSQQCYGYGEEGDCKSAVFANEVPVPEGYYGAEGGELVSACLLFDEWLEVEDFEGTEEGEWVGVRAGSIRC
jgi:hypothetical protein